MPSFFNADEINGRLISIDGSTLDSHVVNIANPHAVKFSDILSTDPTLSADFGLYDNKIINLADPSDNNDGVNKVYVDSLVSGLLYRWTPAKAVTEEKLPDNIYAGTPNYTLTGDVNGELPLIDNIQLAVNDIVLVKKESNKKNRGIYLVNDLGSASTPWVLKRRDQDGSYDLNNGDYIFIDEGSVRADSAFVLHFRNGVGLDIGDQHWKRYSRVPKYKTGDGLYANPNRTFHVNVDDSSIKIASNEISVKNISKSHLNFTFDAAEINSIGYTNVQDAIDILNNGVLGVAGTAIIPNGIARYDILYDNVGIGINGVNQLFLRNSGVKNNNLDKINIPLSGFGIATSDVDIGRKLINISDPTIDSDAANKKYVDDSVTTGVNSIIASNGVQRIGNNFSLNIGSYFTSSGTLELNVITNSIDFPISGKVVDSVILKDYIDNTHVYLTWEEINNSDTIDMGKSVSFINTTNSGQSGNIINGTVMAQSKKICAKNISNEYTLNISNFIDAYGVSTLGLKFNSGQSADLLWNGANWTILNSGAVLF